MSNVFSATFLALSVLLLWGCADEGLSRSAETKGVRQTSQQASYDSPEAVQKTLEMMAMQGGADLWQRMDKAYREGFSAYPEAKALRSQCVFYLVEVADLTKEADLATVKYYFDEYRAADFPINTELLVPFIERLEAEYPEVLAEAKATVDKSKAYARANFAADYMASRGEQAYGTIDRYLAARNL